MILVDVQALQLGTVYDFELEEEKRVEEILADVIALIGKKEKKKAQENTEFYLYAMNKERILSKELTLKEQGITDGERLVLI